MSPDVPVYVCNQDRYGYILTPLEDSQSIEDDYLQLTNLLMEASGIFIWHMTIIAQAPSTMYLELFKIVDFSPAEPHELLADYLNMPPKTKMGFDEIFLINLERRPERRMRMEWSLNQLGLQHKLINAVDGK